ncbi:hypothetical protein IPV08_22710 [Methylobacterium sp. SD274]|uniref:hypothetical protein n=1 Tax=Methylobacterium sp. SD274 TaxID=2782009 RepID=UPI001A96EC60|nr:hypothetical protein [Methylobacterium sp. SD274]MBO1022774.1 hypothetical protein [Methylobacterium sp. SD274]
MQEQYTGSAGPGRHRRVLAAILGLSFLMGLSEARAAVTGTGGGPETTVTAPHTSTTGQTVPPGAAGAPIVDPNERTDRQKRLDRVLNGICQGC